MLITASFLLEAWIPTIQHYGCNILLNFTLHCFLLILRVNLDLVFFSAAKVLRKRFPEMRVLTTEVHPVAPNHFGQKYFGTE